jgi:histidinol-phosphate/aromatic aminotransferase/cobyric acid decarboxylase-like protein
MPLTPDTTTSLLERGFTRRHLGRISRVMAAGAAGLPLFSEFAQAQQAENRMNRQAGGTRNMMDPDAVRITSNENPLGPCKEGLEALYKVAPMGGRYSPTGENADFVKMIAELADLKQEYVSAYPGSSIPLFNSACAFTSPTRSWTMGNPGYSSGAPKWIGSKTVQVPLRPDMTHDVEAMIKADPNAGAYYVCNPNNPTGTVTPRKDIEYLLEHKPKDAVVVVDEAYIHFTDTAQMCTDLVGKDKDVVVLRTFSKAYGMAGLRAGAAIGRPDLLAKIRAYGGGGFMPITATACAAASMRVKGLMKERHDINKAARDMVFANLDKKGVSFIPSETNFFMMTVKGMTGMQVNEAMAKYKVYIGRTWPVWPDKVRVTVGTMEEMQKFNAALDKVLNS